MARVRQQPPTDPDGSDAVLALTVRPWAPAAVNQHVRLVLGDAECAARDAVWVEISFGLEDAPLTCLRHILQVDGWRLAGLIEQLLNGATPYATWRSGCPPALLMARAGDADAQGNPTYQLTLQLTASALTDAGPRDGSAITFALDRIGGGELLRFGETFDQELGQALDHKWPAATLTGAAASGLEINTFSNRVNAMAYDSLGTDYSHDYLAEPFFREAFEGWLGMLPAGGRALEIGCGHGIPIAATLAAAGLRVTGIDPSAQMIAEVRQAVPGQDIRQLALVELEETNAFDGACCFFSLLCMDPIELRIGLARLHRALKPGAPLLIVSGVPDQFTRTSPLRSVQGRTTWEWPYDHEDMAAVLTAGGQWQVAAEALRFYDTDTLQQIEATSLDQLAADPRYLPDAEMSDPLEFATGKRTVKGVYALVARRMAVGSG
ncbi:MAG: class I SAM-dependent methyltransferase [Caldilineaceae bacterium SB0661_bin_32]|uniref:Class I SAM-dependent methyltransferase n=1 Tax=Caldilineaceae bacterium SB0661_bin_32 TaxID=2605255 RepID=A0A6B1DDU9_9CHLR|nr:class I SAM-dependent methyltransferase [Caldilineaceae bacterium SB0661_bin_32]